MIRDKKPTILDNSIKIDSFANLNAISSDFKDYITIVKSVINQSLSSYMHVMQFIYIKIVQFIDRNCSLLNKCTNGIPNTLLITYLTIYIGYL